MQGTALHISRHFLASAPSNPYLCIMEDRRGEQRKRWWQQHHEGHEVKRSMKRRYGLHDYHSRCIYMVTLVVEGRRPVLGDLCGPDEQHPKPWLRLNELGHRVLQRWHDIPSHYPEVRAMDIQLMPDHLHAILFVTTQVPYHLGMVVNGFKKGCNDASRELLGTTLWERGYHTASSRVRANSSPWCATFTTTHAVCGPSDIIPSSSQYNKRWRWQEKPWQWQETASCLITPIKSSCNAHAASIPKKPSPRRWNAT